MRLKWLTINMEIWYCKKETYQKVFTSLQKDNVVCLVKNWTFDV